jgi:tRNA(fMet)-specific endonuclease VapC
MEEALYDTSAVIELVARRRSIVPGYVSILTVVEYPPVLRYSTLILYPEKRDYKLAVKWQAELRRQGQPLPAVDLIIAAQAYNHNLTLVTLDKHFEVLRRLVAPDLKLVTSIEESS